MSDDFISQVERDREAINSLSDDQRASLTTLLNFFAFGDRIALGLEQSTGQETGATDLSRGAQPPVANSDGPELRAEPERCESKARPTLRLDEAHGIPITELVKYLNVFADKPIVSVGCGPGLCEAEALKMNSRLNFIMVDPAPRSFENVEPKFTIDAATVPELIKTRPELVGNCVLLLIWPNPNDSTYDYQAVELLNPVAVIAIYEGKGAAGGARFHQWLSTVGARSSVETHPLYNPRQITRSETYRMWHYYLTRIQGEMDMELRIMSMITRNDVTVPEALVEGIEDVDLAPPEWDRRRDNEICSIM